jgi:hypothetical protein
MQVNANHTLGTATSHVALMWGSALGRLPQDGLIKAASGTGSSR